jgi:hypothetical protein
MTLSVLSQSSLAHGRQSASGASRWLVVAALLVLSSAMSVSAQTLAWETIEYGPEFAIASVLGSDDADSALNKHALNVDAAGNSVMVGQWFTGANTDWLITKYDSTGALQWRSSLNGQGNRDDFAYAVKRDAVGNYIVAGITAHVSATGAHRCTIAKYDSATGAELWRVNPFPPNIPSTTTPYASSQCLNLAIDADGNAYGVGRVRAGASPATPNTGNSDALIVKVGANGALMWQRVVQGSYAGTTAEPRDSNSFLVAAFGNNAVYMGARLNNNSAGDMDWAVRRFDAAGAVTGSLNESGNIGGNDRPRALAVSEDGTRLAVGGFIFLSGEVRGLFRLFDTANFVSLAAPNFGITGGDSRVNDVSFDSSNNAYYSGARWRLASGSIPAQMQVTAGKVASNGVFQWGNTYSVFSGPGHYSEGFAHTTDAAGNVYVAGFFDPALPVPNTSSLGTASSNFFVAKFAANGDVAETRNIDALGFGQRDRAHAIAFGEGGNLYIAGTVTESASPERKNLALLKIQSSAGLASVWTPITTKRPGSFDTSLRVGNLDPLLGKKAMKVDASGNVYTASRTNRGANADIVVTKHSATGALAWKRTYDSSTSPTSPAADIPFALALDASGNAYVTGMAGGVGAGDVTPYKVFAARFASADGTTTWARQIASPTTTLNAYGFDIAVSADGNAVYVVGENEAAVDANGLPLVNNGSNFFTTRLDAATGVTAWAEADNFLQGGVSRRAWHIAIDPTSNALYVGGRVNAGTDNSDSNTNYAMGVLRYVDNGTSATLSWRRTFDEGVDDDTLGDLSFRPGANGGTLELAGQRAVAGNFQIVLHRLSSLNASAPVSTSVAIDGSNSASGAGDFAQRVLTDAAGNIYVAGLLNNAGTQEGFAVVKLNSAGVELWRRVLNPTPALNFDTAYSMALTVDGPVATGMLFDGTFFMGTAQLRASDGELMWFVEHDSPARDIGVATQVVPSGVHPGRVVVAGWGGANADHQTLVIQAIDRVTCTLKVDGRGAVPRATTDGLIILRRILGIDEGAASNGTSPLNNIDDRDNLLRTLVLRGDYDVDASGGDPDFKDALVILRYLLGFKGNSVTDGLNLTGTRNLWEPTPPTAPNFNNSIRVYLQSCGTS